MSNDTVRAAASAATLNIRDITDNSATKYPHNSFAYDDPTKYYVLIEFAVRHLDFQLAELVSVLNMNGISVVSSSSYSYADPDSSTPCTFPITTRTKSSVSGCICTLVHLQNDDHFPSHRLKRYSNNGKQSSEPKLEKVCTRPFAILCIDYDSPLVPFDADSNFSSNHRRKNEGKLHDIATTILSRCTLVRSVIELWGMATSVEECALVTAEKCVQLSSSSSNTVLNQLYMLHSKQSKSWKLTVHTLGSTYTREEQDTMRHLFTKQLNFDGPVQMTDPDNEFVVIREIELDKNGGPKLQNGTNNNCIISSGQYPSIACYFGRALGGCRSVRRMGGNIPKYDLKQRKYLGPTSMDSELSFIMTNLGQVQKGQFILDPFVGTGSILLSCAARGAYCVGTDIDIRVLRGRSSDENIFSNFRQFKLPPPELIRSDNGIYHRHFRFLQPIYNAIICDPPYGIRAGARKSGSKREHVVEVQPEKRHDHIAQTQTYAVSDVLADLVDVASRTLVLHGWLVYVIPSFATTFDAQVDLPHHPCLELVHVCYQPLSTELGRRFVAMRKTMDYDETKREEYLLNVWKNGPESADKCANIRAKIIEAAKTKPHYEERATIRKEKRRLHREEKKIAKKLLQSKSIP